MRRAFNYNFPVSTVFNLGATPVEYPKDSFGLELEIIGKNLPSMEDLIVNNLHTVWTTHVDGSVRAGPREQAFEYVSTVPLDYDGTVKSLDALMALFEKHKTTIRQSHQTSVHVHVNYRHRPLIEVMNLIVLHAIYETTLVKQYCGETRLANTFCLRLQDALGGIDFITRPVKAPVPDFRACWRGDNRRYLLLNLQSLARFGSIEFRGMRGFESKEQILEWVGVLASFREAAGRFADPQDIIKTYSNLGPRRFTTHTFFDNPALARRILMDKSFESDVAKGVWCAQDIAFSSDWPRKELPTAEKAPAAKTRASKLEIGMPPVEWIRAAEEARNLGPDREVIDQFLRPWAPNVVAVAQPLVDINPDAEPFDPEDNFHFTEDEDF